MNNANENQPLRGRPPKNGETATGHIHIRTTLHRKSAYVRAARPKPLAQWATEILDRAARYEPPQRISSDPLDRR